MAWKVEFTEAAEKEFAKLTKDAQLKIVRYLTKLEQVDNPRNDGKPLKGSRAIKLWRYRIGDYRLICNISDQKLLIIIIKIGHRREVYD